MFEGLRRRTRRREALPEDDPAALLSSSDRASKPAAAPKAHKYAVAEKDSDDEGAADDARSDGEDLLQWADEDLATDFGLMSLKTGSGKAVAIPDEEKLQQAKAMMEAADGNMLGAQALPVGSDWPVVSLVTPDGPSKHIVQPARLQRGGLDLQPRDRSEFKRGRETEQ